MDKKQNQKHKENTRLWEVAQSVDKDERGAMGLEERRQPEKSSRPKATAYKDFIMRVKEFFCDFEIMPISTNPTHGPVTPELLEFIQKTNDKKREESINLLGNKWLLHLDNRAKHKDAQ
jgi:hypothetical protein